MWSHEDIVPLVNDAVSRNEVIIICAHCKVRYSGKAESFLDSGDRIIIIKSDKAVIVHQPEGNNPVNYMKPGSSVKCFIEENILWIHAENLPLKDMMHLELERVYYFNSNKMEDGRDIIITGTEEDMSNMLYAQPELIEKGFTPVSREEQTKYGFIDVFGYDKNGVLTIVECKRYRAELSAVTQLRRYVEKIEESKGVNGVRGILAAPKITENAFKMLKDWGYSFVSVNPPKYLEEFDKKQAKLDGFFA